MIIEPTASKYPLTQEEFEGIYRKVPRLNVEVVVRSDRGTVLTRRAIEPCKGFWHIPGGTVRFKESLPEAVVRVAEDELGVKVAVGKLLGYIEYPDMYKNGYWGWAIGIAFEATILEGELSGSEQAEVIEWFKQIPDDTVLEQKEFLVKHPFPR